jgi:hypothetical protein
VAVAILTLSLLRSSAERQLVTLLRLEFIVLGLFIVMYYYLCQFNYELSVVIFFLVFVGL